VKKSLIFFTVLLTAIFSYSCAAWAGVPSEVIPSNELEGSALETSVDNIIPESVNDTYEVDQDTTLEIDAPGVLENDSDADEDELTVVVVSEPTNGTLTINEDGSFTYTPDAGFIGEDTFTYQAYDGEAYSEAAIVKITVLKVNTAPEAVDDEYDVSQDTVLEIAASGVLANDSDAKCDELTAEVVSGPGNGTLTFNDDGSFTYIPNEGFTGLDTFKYKAYDGEAYSNIATVMITVLKVKTAPVAEDDFFEMDENTELVVSAPGVLENDSDVDGDELTAVLVSEPSNGWIDFYSDGSFTYYPDYGFSGQDTFTYKVFDGNANSYEATVSIEVYDTVLEIYGWDLEDGEYSLDDLSFLEDMENLKVLRLSSALSPDANLEPLAGLTGLEELVLYDCNLNNSDLQYLAGLTNLRVLELSWNSISDLSALSRLTSLRALDLSGNNISDLRALSGCINLEWLWLWSNNIDLSTLPQSLANLTILDLSWNNVSDLSVLSGYSNLQDLNLRSNNIDLSTLPQNLANLTILDLSENEIGNIDEDMGAILSNLKNLDYLALDNCKLKDISGLRMLASLERLRVLSLNDNNIQSIVPLKSLTNLGHIYPYENHIYLYENYDINFSDQANIDAYETLINNGVYVYLSQDSYLENTAPVAGDDFFEMDENTELAVSAPGVLENDSDADGDELTAVLVSEPSHGWIDFYSDGSFTYYPDYGFSGQDSFTYKAFDGNANSYEVTVTIEVLDTVLEIYGWDLPYGAYSLDDLSFLEDIENLKVLRLWNALSPDANFEPLAGLTGLEELVLFDCNLDNNDLQYLANLIGLRVLNLSWNNINDFTFLSGLTNLEQLSLWSCEIEDISSFPKNLINLRVLDLEDNYINDLGALSGFTNLENLHLAWNCIESLRTFPQSLTKLRVLDLGGNKISDLSALSECINLEDLWLWSNNIQDLSTLPQNLINLICLDLSRNKITDISALSVFTNLETLSLSCNDFGNIDEDKGAILSQLTNLNYLNLDDCELNDISGLSMMASLENLSMLSLRSNNFQSIVPLAILTNLFDLYLYDNYDIDFNNPANIEALETLRNRGVYVYLSEDGNNSAPVALDDFYQVAQNAELIISAPGVLGNDWDDGDELQAELVRGPLNGTLTFNKDGAFTYIPNKGFTGKDTFTYKVFDGKAHSEIVTVTITVIEVSPDSKVPTGVAVTDGPKSTTITWNPVSEAVKYNIYRSYSSGKYYELIGTVDGQTYSYKDNSIVEPITYYYVVTSVNENNQESAFSIEGAVSFPEPPYVGAGYYEDTDDSLIYSGEWEEKSNEAASGGSFYCTSVPNASVTLFLSSGSEISILATKYPDGGIADIYVDGKKVGTVDFYSPTTLWKEKIFTISDLSWDTFHRVDIVATGTKNPSSSGYYINLDSLNIISDGDYSFELKAPRNVTATKDSDSVTISWEPYRHACEEDHYYIYRSNTSGTGFELIGIVNHPTASFKDTAIKAGTTSYYVVTTHIKWTNKESDYSSEVAITINTVPVAVNETYEVDQDTVLEIAAPGVLGNDTDADNDNLTAELVSEPTSGTLELNEDGSFTYTPDEGFTGEDSFIYKAYDGEAYSSEAEVTITVHKKDTEPVEPTTIESFDIGGTEFYAGGSYKLSANATSASKQQLYKFFVRDSNLNWTVLKDYNETNSVTWDATKPGQYLLVVHVKDSESTESYDTFTSRSVTVKDTTIESFTVGSGSDFYHGNSYTVSANADSANDQLYKFYVRDSNLNWTVLKEYSEANSATWDATKPGQYLLVVHVKDSESTKDYDTFTSMSVTVKETPTDINSFEIEGTSFFTGGSYNLSANATSASEQQLYKFFVRDSNLNWTVLKDYNEINSVTWNPTKPGQYLLVVHVKDSESTKDYDTFTSMSVTVKETPTVQAVLPSALKSYTLSANAIQC
jgi:VCBS repeat-containing protein